MSNVTAIPWPDRSQRAFMVGSRKFVCTQLGSSGWKLLEVSPCRNEFTRCLAYGERDAQKVVTDYLEVESSTACNVPNSGGSGNGISLQEHVDWKNKKPATRKGGG